MEEMTAKRTHDDSENDDEGEDLGDEDEDEEDEDEEELVKPKKVRPLPPIHLNLELTAPGRNAKSGILSSKTTLPLVTMTMMTM